MQIRMNQSHRRDEFCAAAVQGAEVQPAGLGQDEVSQGHQKCSFISSIQLKMSAPSFVRGQGGSCLPTSFYLMVYCHARSHCSLWVST